MIDPQKEQQDLDAMLMLMNSNVANKIPVPMKVELSNDENEDYSQISGMLLSKAEKEELEKDAELEDIEKVIQSIAITVFVLSIANILSNIFFQHSFSPKQ